MKAHLIWLMLLMSLQPMRDSCTKVEIVKEGAELGEATKQGLEAAIRSLFPELAKQAWDYELVAWACKLQDTKEIPHIIDDIVVVATSRSDGNRKIILSLRRFRGSGELEQWVHNMKWTANDCGGAAEWYKMYAGDVGSDALTSFIRASNFGNNEIFDDTKTVAIYMFREGDSELVTAVEAGISNQERIRRRDLFMEMNASPVPGNNK